jgi:hypothetical protein
MSSTSVAPKEDEQPAKKGPRLWLWFVLGFLIVFVGLALLWPMHFNDGRSLRQTWLWQYYMLAIELERNSSGNLGPTSGNAAAAMRVFGMHLVLSAGGGIVNAAIGWAIRKRTNHA